jgi:LysR family transcriptional activator of mexEF-oprN operon
MNGMHSTDMNFKHFRRVDLNLLVLFGALVEQRSTVKAGERLHLSQSAVSHALGRLRKLFHDDLFVRSGRTLVPTPKCLALWNELLPTLTHLERVTSVQPAFDPATSERVFRIGMPSAVDVALTLRLLKRLRSEAPRVNLVIRPASVLDIPDKLDQDEVDLAVGVVGSLKPWHESTRIGQRGYACVWHPKQLRVAAPIALDDYLAAAHVLTSFGGDRRGVVDEALEAAGKSRRVAVAAADFTSAAMYLTCTRAIATIPEYAARAFAHSLGLTLSPVPLKLPPIRLVACWHHRFAGDAGHAWFRSVVVEECRQI